MAQESFKVGCAYLLQGDDILAADTIVQAVVNVWKCIQHAITVIAFRVAIDTDWLVVIRTTE